MNEPPEADQGALPVYFDADVRTDARLHGDDVDPPPAAPNPDPWAASHSNVFWVWAGVAAVSMAWGVIQGLLLSRAMTVLPHSGQSGALGTLVPTLLVFAAVVYTLCARDIDPLRVYQTLVPAAINSAVTVGLGTLMGEALVHEWPSAALVATLCLIISVGVTLWLIDRVGGTGLEGAVGWLFLYWGMCWAFVMLMNTAVAVTISLTHS